MQIKKQPDMEQQSGSKLGKEYVKAAYCHPDCLTPMKNASCKMQGWMKHKVESRSPGEISETADMQMTNILMAKSKELKRPLMMKEESEKVGLKLKIQKTKIMTSGPIARGK